MTDTELKKLVIEKINNLVEGAKKDYPQLYDIVIPEIKFTKRGKVSGCVEYEYESVKAFNFNMVLLRENTESFLETTVPHEIAHFLVHFLHGFSYTRSGRRIIHGKNWKNMMRYLGVDPNRCHSYNTDNCTTRRLKKFTYKCGCRSYELTSIRHNRVMKGTANYRCKHCGQSLEYVG